MICKRTWSNTAVANSNCILVLHIHLQHNNRNTNEIVYCYDLKHDAKTNLKATPINTIQIKFFVKKEG